MSKPNTDTHNKPLNTCMIVGCNKKAIYKNAQTAKTSRAKEQHGYCSDHKSYAICKVTERSIDHSIKYIVK